ncbi:hypothetical protein [Cylindrospermopsis raciborskii]|nr:hypothetical protein [Cylindrospermopsis raciborskii]
MEFGKQFRRNTDNIYCAAHVDFVPRGDRLLKILPLSVQVQRHSDRP